MVNAVVVAADDGGMLSKMMICGWMIFMPLFQETMQAADRNSEEID